MQWNLEGGSTTDLRSNTSASYYNFDSLEQIQVINGGGDVSVQSSGVSINLITKSGSNVFKGSAVGTLTNDAMQFQNVSEELFKTGTGGFLSGAPLNRVTNVTFEFGGPIMQEQALVLGQRRSPGHQHRRPELLRREQERGVRRLRRRAAARHARRHDHLRQPRQRARLPAQRQDRHLPRRRQAELQLNSAHKFQYLLQGDDKIQNSRGASATTAKEATNRQFSDYWHGIPQPTHSLTHTYVASDKLVFNNIYTYVYGGWTNDFQDYDTCGEIRYNGSDESTRLRARRQLPVEPAAALAADDRLPQPLAARRRSSACGRPTS